MIFFKGTMYAKVWKVSPEAKYIDLRVSTSEKKEDGSFASSTWFPRVIGHAFNTLKNVKEGDRICITKAKLTNENHKKADTEEIRSVFKFLILEATIEGAQDDNNNQTTPPPASEPAASQTSEPAANEDEPEEDCPW